MQIFDGVTGDSTSSAVQIDELTQQYGGAVALKVDGLTGGSISLEVCETEGGTFVAAGSDSTVSADGVKILEGLPQSWWVRLKAASVTGGANAYLAGN